MNKSQGLFLCPGAIGAGIRPGGPSSGPSPNMGDRLLIDLENRFFAVSDGADRSPEASYYFLNQALEMAENWPELRQGGCLTPEKVREIGFKLETLVNELMAGTPFNQNCTFTGVLVLETAQGPWLAVAHAGDSRLYGYLPGGDLTEISKPNFWLVGKSTRLYQMELVPCRPGEIFLLATDGLDGLAFPEGEPAARALARLMLNYPVEDLPGLVFEKFDRREGPKDDLGFMFLRPDGLPRRRTKMIFPGKNGAAPPGAACPEAKVKP
ncbi:MAG: hypothetical protein V1816_23405 [Pseudomonadota bacterium]